MFDFKDYIYEVYKNKSFTIASQKLYISQPALSICVKKTEEKLGAEIFDRTTSPIGLTEYGKEYISAIEEIYQIENRLVNKVCDIGNLNSGSLSVGGSNATFTCVLPEILKIYSEKYPKIQLSLLEASSKDLKNNVLQGQLDIIIDYDFNNENFLSYSLKTENIFLCAKKDSVIAKKHADKCFTRQDLESGEFLNKKSVDIALFKNYPFIMLKRLNDMQKHASKIFAEQEINPIIKMELDQLKTCYELACRGLGITFVTDTLVQNAGNDNGVYFRLRSQHAKRELSLAHKKTGYISASKKKFIEETLKHFNKI